MAQQLLRSTATVGQMTLVSRVLGFLRDLVIAYSFGAKEAADAFFVAFKIPNLFRRLFAEGAFAQAFVPVLSEVKTQEDELAVKALVDAVAGAGRGLSASMALVLGITDCVKSVIPASTSERRVNLTSRWCYTGAASGARIVCRSR